MGKKSSATMAFLRLIGILAMIALVIWQASQLVQQMSWQATLPVIVLY